MREDLDERTKAYVRGFARFLGIPEGTPKLVERAKRWRKGIDRFLGGD